MSLRLLAVNPTISEKSVHILLERGLIKVEGGMALFCSCKLWDLIREKKKKLFALRIISLCRYS